MTFDPNVPNASQSPGLFPAQNNTNFARLKTIINADHVFNDTAQTTDGVHRQVTLISRAVPVSLPGGTNAILYSWVDALSRTQLRFYNGSTDVQLTPPSELFPMRIYGSASVTGLGTAVAYADPGFLWAGTGYALLTSQNASSFWNILRSGANDFHKIDDNGSSSLYPTFFFSGNDLMVRNQSASTQSITWSLIINRIS